ncbi:MAG: SDR family NAD(P)-dependent oxidoreductase [Nitrospirae bacterium]|nr:SDR family NAD(P)-dependent oxidoreductase [Nitrospirota bacterium]
MTRPHDRSKAARSTRATDRRPVALVTGASRGLGRILAIRLGEAGYRVAVHYHTAGAASTRVCRTIRRAGGDALALPADLRDPRAAAQLVSRAMATWRRLDLLVHNAGVTRDGLVLRMEDGAWHDVIATHLTGGFYLMQSAAQVMKRQRGGHIVTIGSLAGLLGRAGQANYAAAKAGLIALTKAAAREWAPHHIRVNCVLPGYLPLGMGRRLPPPQRRRLRDEGLLGGGSAQETADWVVMLAASRRASGQVFNLDSRLV